MQVPLFIAYQTTFTLEWMALVKVAPIGYLLTYKRIISQDCLSSFVNNFYLTTVSTHDNMTTLADSVVGILSLAD